MKNILYDVNNYKMYVDKCDSLELIKNGIYELEETRFLSDIINSDDIVIDIGANIGYYTLLFAKEVGSNGTVFAFEPDKDNLEILKQNILVNNINNCSINNFALGERTECGILYLSTVNMGDHRLYNSRDNRVGVSVKVKTLDECLANEKRTIRLIKIDTQGSELKILKGAKRTIAANIDNIIIFTEFWPIGLRRSGVQPIDLFKLFLEYDLTIYELIDKRLVKGNIDTLLEIHDSLNSDFNSGTIGSFTNLIVGHRNNELFNK